MDGIERRRTVVRSQLSGRFDSDGRSPENAAICPGRGVAPQLQSSFGMNAAHEKVLNQEMTLARELMERGNLDGAIGHLERAHVLGQAHAGWHVLAHWLMLEIAIRRHQGTAALGQAVRIDLGAIGSAVGFVPTGNTGGSDVSMFAHMPIAPELMRVMQTTDLERGARGYCVEKTKSCNT